jgi:hypothetical protein
MSGKSTFSRHLIPLLLASCSIAGSAAAQQRPSIIGTWEHTEAASAYGPANVVVVEFDAHGTIRDSWAVAPSADGKPGGISEWQGAYRLTGANSFVFGWQNFTTCFSGICMSCPGDERACGLTRSLGWEVGGQYSGGFRMNGPNEMYWNTLTWHRVR